jgi:hypothetical protein
MLHAHGVQLSAGIDVHRFHDKCRRQRLMVRNMTATVMGVSR